MDDNSDSSHGSQPRFKLSFKPREIFSRNKKKTKSYSFEGTPSSIQNEEGGPLLIPDDPNLSLSFQEDPLTKDSPTLPSPPPYRHRTRSSEQLYESLDYDICYNAPYKEHLRRYTKCTYIHTQIMRWLLVGMIGAFTGIIAFIIDISVRYLFQLKFSLFDKVYDATLNNGMLFLGFLVLLGLNVLFAVIAAILIFAVPEAAGSGVPEIKCYLNGIKVPNITRITTLFSKTVGVLFAVVGGFLVGKEGPMIHSGAIVGAGLSQFRSWLFKSIKIPYPYFRSDRYKRDFASSGAAAGVAAAFGAPLGGVLFSLEGGASFWNQGLTWRTLFCSFCATFTLNLFISVSHGDKFGHIRLGSPGLVDFGTFSTEAGTLWNAYHLLIFLVMGAVGGLLGALFNSLNITLYKYRMKYLHQRGRIWRVIEALLIIMTTTATIFLAAIFLGTCVRKDDLIDSSCTCSSLNFDNTTFQNETREYFCPSNGDFTFLNDMATLTFNSPEVAVKQLFHQDGAFTLSTLWILFLIYFFVACWTHGAGISAGIFLPCLLIGATYGRITGMIFGYLDMWHPHVFGFLTNLYPGTYALIGAASFLGGVVRMTISLTAILIESTNEISLGLPIMLSILVAKWVGDLFNDGLYSHHIELKNTSFLDWESPEQTDALIAADVINSTNLSYVYPITRVAHAEKVLKTTTHSAFLVVTPVDSKKIPYRRRSISDSYVHIQLSRMSDLISVSASDYDRHSAMDKELHELTSSILDVSSRPNGTSQCRRRKNPTGTQKYVKLDREESDVFEEQRDNSEVLTFHGIILRSQLAEMFKNKVFFNESDGPKSQKELSYSTLVQDYPRFPNIADYEPTDAEKEMLMDLKNYMNPCPYTISHEAPLPQVFNLFRTMGLRHLPVLGEQGIVVGIITRHDLTQEKVLKKIKQKKLKRRL